MAVPAPQLETAASSGTTPLEIREITEATQLDRLRPEWSELFDRSEATPFQSPEWLLNWQRVFALDTLWTLAIYRGERLIGLVPMYIWIRPRDSRRQLTLLGNGISDHLDVIAARVDAPIVSDAVYRHLAHRADVWDSCDFRDLPAHSSLLSTPFPGDARERIASEEACPIIRLPDDPAEVVERLARKRRSEICRTRRRLSELGQVAYRTADLTDCRCWFAELVRLHESRWRARGERGALSDPAVRRFHEEAMGALLRRDLLRLDVLTVDGRPIAAHYGLRTRHRASSYIIGFDPEFSTFGPNTLLLAHVMEECVREGFRELDLLRGREPYKYRWGPTDQPKNRRRIERLSR